MTKLSVVEHLSNPELDADKATVNECLQGLIGMGLTTFSLVGVNEQGETVRAHHLTRDLLRIVGGLQYETYTVNRIIETDYTDRLLSDE